jgi:hypothetical protein
VPRGSRRRDVLIYPFGIPVVRLRHGGSRIGYPDRDALGWDAAGFSPGALKAASFEGYSTMPGYIVPNDQWALPRQSVTHIKCHYRCHLPNDATSLPRCGYAESLRPRVRTHTSNKSIRSDIFTLRAPSHAKTPSRRWPPARGSPCHHLVECLTDDPQLITNETSRVSSTYQNGLSWPTPLLGTGFARSRDHDSQPLTSTAGRSKRQGSP